uniref:Laminin IV type A domain-containing protein n=1 Tax=Hemiselmis tepida TaxID=464990 RepID=A0A7S0YYW7_9CRYP
MALPLATQALRLLRGAPRRGRTGMMPRRGGWALALAAALVASAALCVSGQTHRDSTRYKTHTNDNGMALAQGSVGDPGTRGFKDPAQYLNPHTASETQGARLGAVLARSNPAGSTDGWQGVRQAGAPSSTRVVSDAAAGVSGSDSGSEVWYFMAPSDRFAGDLASAYNGRLSFTLTHSEAPSSAKATRAPDVILEASCGHSLMLYGLAERGGTLSVMLNEDAGWIDSRTRRPPGVMDFLGVLSHLAAVKVRGGYYSGAESTRLSAVSLTSGKAWYPCCTIDGTVDICQKQPSSYYNPPNLRYYCEGHMYRPVRVTRVLPRFSRRTGGATVTVVGENFGLAGSSPIVRINGRPCQKTYFPPSIVKSNYNGVEVSGVSNTHLLGGTGDQLLQPSNPAGNALVNAYSTASDSMKQRYPEHCWNGMQDDGTDKGYNYGTTTAPKYIDQGESGVDTGGACFPMHCSSCPVPTMVTGQKVAGVDWNMGSGIPIQPTYSGNLAGQTGLTFTLANDASDVDDFYKGWILTCPAAPYSRVVTGYVASTRVITVAAAFTGCSSVGDAIVIKPLLDVPTTGTAAGGSATTITLDAAGDDKADTAGTVAADTYTGLVVTITGGTCAGISREITAHAVGTITVATMDGAAGGAATCTPTTDSTYSIASPDLGGRCSARNQIAAYGSGNCKERSTTTAGASSACNFGFPYVKYPALCPEDADYTTTLNSMYTEATTGALRSTLQRGIWGMDGIFASVDKNHKMVEGMTRVTHPNPMKADTSTATTGAPSKVVTIEVEDAVALCGIEVGAGIGVNDLSETIAADIEASEVTTITVTVANGNVNANTAHFGPKNAANANGWTTTQALDAATAFGNGYVMVENEIIKVSAVGTSTLTIAQRGAFGTPVTKHTSGKAIYPVSVCRGAVLSFAPSTGQRDVAVSYPSLTPTAAVADRTFGAVATTTTAVELDPTSSSVDGYYVGMTIEIITVGAATGSLIVGDSAKIASYDGTTKVATLTPEGFITSGSPSPPTGLVAADTVYVISNLMEGYAFADVTTASTIQLSHGAAASDDYYIGMRIKITSGTGVGLERTITDYVASTRTATVDGAWSLLKSDSKYAIAPAKHSVFYAVSHREAECRDSHCTLEVSNVGEILNKLHVGDVVRRVASGRSKATTTLSNNGVALGVESVAALFGATFAFDTAAKRIITCGSDTALDVTAASLLTNQVTVTTGSANNLGTTCTPGTIVTVKAGTAALTGAGTAADAYTGPGFFNYYTTFDAAGVADSPLSDVAEFAPYRYIQMGSEIMRITAVADANSGADATSRAANGLERLTVARGQMGSHVEAHPRGQTVKLLPRMAEVTVAMTVSDAIIYLPNGMDIVSNNLGVVTQTATAMVAASAVAGQTGIAGQGGGSRIASYIKIDDEIMRVTAATTYTATDTSEGNVASLTVLRAQAGTLATPHAAGAVLTVLGCMDGDETGSNCGGSCKPCTSKAKGGPTQHDKLICVTPEGTKANGDLPVTVEAQPGPRESPFAVRSSPDGSALVDSSTSAVSCISEQNRGFQYGAHDFVWGVHIKARDERMDVKITDVAVDRNTGDSYVVGTMVGTIYVQGKHIHMSKDFGGELEVAPAQNTYISGTSGTNAPTTTTIDDATAGKVSSGYANEYLGKLVELTYTSTGAICSSRATTVTGAGVLTVEGFARSTGTCDAAFANTDTYKVYKGSAGFIAKFSKDGRPVWLNKLDTADATNAHELVVTSVAVDPTSGHHYVAGHYSDGWKGYDDASTPTLNYYNVDSATRVAGTAAAGTVVVQAADNYGQTPASVDVAAAYQEGFIIKYSSAGQFVAREAIKGGKLADSTHVSNLIVRAFHPSTSATLNTQTISDAPPPTVKTSTTQLDVEYDYGMVAASPAAAVGGGTESRSSVTLAPTAATYYPPSGQVLTNSGETGATEAMDDWYNGLKITITCGKGMGQTRTIVDYVASTRVAYVQPHWDGETMLPDATSCYTISGKPSSHSDGRRLISGGIYVTGNVWDPRAATNAGDEYVCFGEMPDAYRDTSSPLVGIPVCARLTVDDEEVNFVAQYDLNLRAYWVRFIYDGTNAATTQSDSGLIKAVAAVDDMVIVAGTFGKNQWTSGTNSVALRLQNCTFDTSAVAQGPPANAQPTVVTLKKLCRMQSTTLTDIGSFPVQGVNDLMSAGTKTQTGARSTTAQDFGILSTLSTDFVALPAQAASATTNDMYVAAYDGSGSLLWYHYTSVSGGSIAYTIEPTAIASVQPAIGNKPLTGHWKTLSDRYSLRGRGQPGDATAAKDISSEMYDTATIRGGFVYVAGNIKTTTSGRYADFGITREPVECSRTKSVGKKDSTAAILNKLQDTPCAGHLQSLRSAADNFDVFLAKYSVVGAPRTDTTYTTYGTGRQPEVHYVRRTGMVDVDEVATGVAVHDLTGAAFVVGTYKGSAASKYQGSDIGEKTYLASSGADGGYTYKATRESIAANSGDDHFGLSDANRVNSVGCPMQRFAPLDEHEERIGLTGLPDCTMYSHAAATGKTTGFVVKFNDNGDETLRGNKNGKTTPSITGRLSASGACGAAGGVMGTLTCQSSVAPCSGGTGGTGETQFHVYTGTQSCSTYPGGCSCVFIDAATLSKGSGGSAEASTGDGTANTWNGKRIRITKGKAAGYVGVISAYEGGDIDEVFFTVPALPEVPDHTSEFQISNNMEPQPKIHMATCASSTVNAGCSAHGVEWAKTIGLPIGQTAYTRGAYGAPTNVYSGFRGTWKVVGKVGAAAASGNYGGQQSVGDELFLNVADAVGDTAGTAAFYNDYVFYLTTDTVEPYTNVMVGEVIAGSYLVATSVDGSGGSIKLICRSAVVVAADDVALSGVTKCPMGATVRYRVVKKSATTGVSQLVSSGARQESAPVSVNVVDGDVYVGGTFRGFDQFHFGLEGVDETVGYKSVGFDTWESYLVKLED